MYRPFAYLHGGLGAHGLVLIDLPLAVPEVHQEADRSGGVAHDLLSKRVLSFIDAVTKRVDLVPLDEVYDGHL